MTGDDRLEAYHTFDLLLVKPSKMNWRERRRSERFPKERTKKNPHVGTGSGSYETRLNRLLQK
jgi:hypothetical protein